MSEFTLEKDKDGNQIIRLNIKPAVIELPIDMDRQGENKDIKTPGSKFKD